MTQDQDINNELNGYIRQGAQGKLDAASKSSLENEFGTHDEEEVVKQILEKGKIGETEVYSPFQLSNSP